MKKADKEACNKVLQKMKKIPRKTKEQLKPLVQKLLTSKFLSIYYGFLCGLK